MRRFLIVDLERPERFWHMMFQSERVHEALAAGWPLGGWGAMLTAPILKWWSPMSIGAWAITAFGAWSFLSFLATFWNPRPVAWLVGPNLFGHAFHIVGSGLGFFVASYTGVLLAATNQPLWSVSEWIAPLFLTSATSTAIAIFLLLARGISQETCDRLERADLWALGLELFLFLIFLASLGGLLPMALTTWQGWILVAGTLVAGLLFPLGLHLFGNRRVTLAALFGLAGGFMLRFGMVSIAPALLTTMQQHPSDAARAFDLPLFVTLPGAALIALTLVLAVAIPLALRRQWRLPASQTGFACVVSALAVAAVIFYSVQPLSKHPDLLAAAGFSFSPEDRRPPGGGVGASFFNRPVVMVPRSKVLTGEPP